MEPSRKRALSKSEIIAEEDLVIDVQFLLQDLIDAKGMTRSELAERVGLSKARLSQLMKPDANPTLRTLARVFHALGEELCAQLKSSKSVESRGRESAAAWEIDKPANDVGIDRREARDLIRSAVRRANTGRFVETEIRATRVSQSPLYEIAA